MTSVIIPAHNEENVISQALTSLKQSSVQPLEIIVVCNGCTDNTAKIVKSFDNDILLIETTTASKTHALNLGDDVAKSFPRIYMDADIRLSPDAIDKMSQTLANNYLATSPDVVMDLIETPWLVRAYYEIWLSLPYCTAGMIGAGVYALSEQGRNRFDAFPQIVADDGYIRALFSEEERTKTTGCHSIVHAPKSLSGLIKIKTRSRLGGYELKEKFPELSSNEEKNYKKVLLSWIVSYKKWPKILVYLFVNIYVKFRAKRFVKNKLAIWERDDTSRNRELQ